MANAELPEITERGHGRPVLLLHDDVDLAERLATAQPARVITPTLPGTGDAAAYNALLDRLDLIDVTVIGGSVAVELALLGSPRVIGVVLLDPTVDTDAVTQSKLVLDDVDDHFVDRVIEFARSTAGNLVSIVGPGQGEVMMDGPVKFRMLEDGTNTGHRLGFGEIVLGPHTDGPPQHRHARHDEGFYVVSGTVRFTVGEASHDAGPGTLVMVPPGAPHTFANPTSEPAMMVNTFTPDFYVHYFRELRALAASGQPITREATIDAMSRYDTVPADDFAE